MSAELLSPAGDMEKLKTAVHFGADAVYLSGKDYGLRAFCSNFDTQELKEAAQYLHERNKKMYVTLNISAFDADFEHLKDYLLLLTDIKADAVIVSDLGILDFIKKQAGGLDIHLSTQANITNSYAVRFFASLGVKRIIPARELTVEQIAKIVAADKNVQIETFVHGAMCMAHSGRCLLSAHIDARSGNRGECSQICRRAFSVRENQSGEEFDIAEDSRGTYLLSSRDLNMLPHIDALLNAGVAAFKIEGRAKTLYYNACVTNAYRRALDLIAANKPLPEWLISEPYNAPNRGFTTGFYFSDPRSQLSSGGTASAAMFCAIAVKKTEKGTVVQMRNRFKTGDTLQILSPDENMNKSFTINKMYTENGKQIDDAKGVCMNVLIPDVFLEPYDILRRA